MYIEPIYYVCIVYILIGYSYTPFRQGYPGYLFSLIKN